MGQGCAHGLLVSMCSSVHEVLNSVPRTMKERERRESRCKEFHLWLLTFISFSPTCLLGFLIFPFCGFFFFEKKSFSYATSVKRASALFYIKTPFKNPHKVDKMAQLVTADPRLSWWKENQFYPVDL